MLKGDLSNEVPSRVLVTLEAVTEGKGVPPKKRFQSWEKVAEDTAFEQVALNRLWLFGNRTGALIELVLFDVDYEYQIALGQRLELGLDPFRYIEGYASREALLAHLAYRPDVVGVVDTAPLIMQWGSRGMSLADVSRI